MNRRFSLARSTSVISAATLLSRVLGLARDSLIARYLGGVYADAFLAAFRIPSLLRELFAEGALSSAFVPTLSRTLKEKGEEEAKRLAGSVLRLLALVVAGVTLLGVLGAPWIAGVFLAGRVGGEELPLATGYLRVMFPYLFVISLAAVTMGLLNALLRFAVPALSPALLNVCMIAALIAGYLRHGPENPAAVGMWLAWGVLIGGAMQFVSQLIQARALGYFTPLWGPLLHPQTGHMLRLMGPRAMAAAVTQLSVVISTILASFLPIGSISILWWAVRLFQFPLGVLGIAITTATFPKLSQDAGEADRVAYQKTLNDGLRATLLVMLPAMLGLIAVSDHLVGAVYNHGAFRAAGLQQITSLTLVAYCVGLVGHAAAKLLATAFFALHDTKTPLYVSMAGLAVHVAASLALMQVWGVVGLALATSVTGLFQMLLLGGLLRTRAGVRYAPLAGFALRALGASLVMYGATWAVLRLAPPADQGIALALPGVALGAASGMATYALLVYLVMPEERARLTRLARLAMRRKSQDER